VEKASVSGLNYGIKLKFENSVDRKIWKKISCLVLVMGSALSDRMK